MKKLTIFTIIMIMLCSLLGCKVKEQKFNEHEKDMQVAFNAFDTQCAISIYYTCDEETAQAYMANMRMLIMNFENTFSKTLEDSDVWNINHRTSDEVFVTEETATLMELGKSFYDWTGGKFDISAGTLIDLWDVKNRKTLPTLTEINEARSHCGNFNYTVTHGARDDEKSAKIVFNGDKKTKYDFGALIKGFCSDRLREMLNENSDIKACIINLGGNVCVTGKISTRRYGAFNVGIFRPFATSSEIIDTVKVVDKNVITSGIYERYFKVENDDRIYHHIIDPTTGYPTDNGLLSVTVISDNGLLGDFMSTACMLLGVKNSEMLIDNCAKSFSDKNIQCVFIDSNENIRKYPKKAKLY